MLGQGGFSRPHFSELEGAFLFVDHTNSMMQAYRENMCAKGMQQVAQSLGETLLVTLDSCGTKSLVGQMKPRRAFRSCS